MDFDLKKLTGTEMKEVERLAGVKMNDVDNAPVDFQYALYFVWNKRANAKLQFKEVLDTVTFGEIEEFFGAADLKD